MHYQHITGIVAPRSTIATRRTARSHLIALCTIALATFAMTGPAQASHFRFAHTTWNRVSGTTVEFTSTQAWRADAVETLAIDFGDGSPLGTGSPTTIGTFTDLAGDPYTVLRYNVQHTYASEGPFLASLASCCRIFDLVNASSASERIEVAVDLRNGNQGSPVSSSAVIVQMVQGGMNTRMLPVADPELDPLACRMATAAESEIPTVATAGGQTLSVAPNCTLSWDTSGTVVGQKYAAQVVIEENHAGNVSHVGIDFIIEIVGGTLNQSPSCNGISSPQIVNVGQAFMTTFTGTDPDGDNLTVSHLGLPPGATLTPSSGTTQPQPFPADFAWTPQPSDAGSAYAITIAFTDPQGLQGTCGLSITVPKCGDGVIDPPEQCDPGTAPSCPSGQVCTNACVCAVPTDTPTPQQTPTVTLTPTPSDTPVPTDTATATLSPTPTATPTSILLGCAAAPAPESSCKQLLKKAHSKLRMWNYQDDKRDRIDWQWRFGEGTAAAEFGDPTTDTRYALCIYDGNDQLIFSASVPAGSNWRNLGKMVKYTDNPGQAYCGIRHLRLSSRSAAPMKASIRLIGLGQSGNLGNESGGGNFPDLGAFPLATEPNPLRAQLVNSEGGCWEARYQAHIGSNGGKGKSQRFKAGND